MVPLIPLTEYVILSPDNDISQLHIARQMHDRQRRLGRIMAKNGVTLKALSIDSGIPYNTLRGYFPSEQAELFPNIMPITALVQLIGTIPDDWLSILTEPEGRCLSKVNDEDDGVAELERARDALNAAIAKKRKVVS